jgi:hypothetical protein
MGNKHLPTRPPQQEVEPDKPIELAAISMCAHIIKLGYEERKILDPKRSQVAREFGECLATMNSLKELFDNRPREGDEDDEF